MTYYILLVIYTMIIVLLAYTSVYLFVNARPSILYQNVALLGFLGSAISLINFFVFLNYLFKLFELNFYFYIFHEIFFVIFIYILFKVWKIRFNQFAYQNYQSLIFLLVLVNIGFIVNKNIMYLPIINKVITNLIPSVLTIILLIIINILFYKSNKLSLESDFRVFPISIFVLFLTKTTLILIDFQAFNPLIYFVFLLIQSLTFLIITTTGIRDFKKSFYY